MTTQELLARLTVAPGDFVTLTAEEAAEVREIMQRRIPITIDPDGEPDHGRHNVAFGHGFDQDA